MNKPELIEGNSLRAYFELMPGGEQFKTIPLLIYSCSPGPLHDGTPEYYDFRVKTTEWQNPNPVSDFRIEAIRFPGVRSIYSSNLEEFKITLKSMKAHHRDRRPENVVTALSLDPVHSDRGCIYCVWAYAFTSWFSDSKSKNSYHPTNEEKELCDVLVKQSEDANEKSDQGRQNKNKTKPRKETKMPSHKNYETRLKEAAEVNPGENERLKVFLKTKIAYINHLESLTEGELDKLHAEVSSTDAYHNDIEYEDGFFVSEEWYYEGQILVSKLEWIEECHARRKNMNLEGYQTIHEAMINKIDWNGNVKAAAAEVLREYSKDSNNEGIKDISDRFYGEHNFVRQPKLTKAQFYANVRQLRK